MERHDAITSHDGWLMGDGCLPSGGFGSLYNQNHNNDDDYQKKEGGYNDGPPHGLQKSSCEKKCICIIPVLRHYAYKIKKKRQIWNHITYEIIE